MPRAKLDPDEAPEDQERRRLHNKVKRILRGGEKGKKELMRDLREGLLLAYYAEREAALNPVDAGRYTEGNARASRKQMKEFSELVLEVEEVLQRDNR